MSPIRLSLLRIRYRGVDAANKIQTGVLFAATLGEAKRNLTLHGITPNSLKAHRLSPKQVGRFKLSASQTTLFAHQLSTMLLSGIALENALNLLSHTSAADSTQVMICRLRHAIGTGLSLSKALEVADKRFDAPFCDLVAAAEKHGDLGAALEQIASLREKQREVVRKVTKALIYPCIVLSVAAIVCVVMLTKVVPQFESMFQSLGSELPAFTLKVLALSDWLQLHGVQTLAGALVATIVISLLLRLSPSLAMVKDRHLLKLPLFGKALRLALLARYLRTLATLLGSGVALTEAIACATPRHNRHFYRQLSQAQSTLIRGESFTRYATQTELFDTTTLQLIFIGEQSGQLAKMLLTSAESHEQSLEHLVDNLGETIEPVMIVVLGTIVGGLVLAMYLPIVSLMTTLG